MDFGPGMASSARYGGMVAILKRPVVIILIAGLLIRFVLMPVFSYGYEVSHWAYTIENIRSGNGLYEISGYYYTPVWGYILGAVSWIMDVFGLDTLASRFDEVLPLQDAWWACIADVTTIQFNIIVTLPLIFCDILVGYLIYRMVREDTGDERKAAVGFALWFLCPIVIFASSVQAMFDTFCVLFMVLSIFLLRRQRYLLCGVAMALAILTKVFPGFLLLALLAYILAKNRGNRPEAVRAVALLAAGLIITSVLVYIPQIMDGTFLYSFSFLTDRMGIGLSSSGEWSIFSMQSLGFMLVIILQPIIVLALIGLAYLQYKESGDPDSALMRFLLPASAVIFLWTPSPQYTLIVIPFLAYYISVHGRAFLSQWMLVGVGATMYDLVTANGTVLFSLAAYTDLLDLGGLVEAILSFQSASFLGIHVMSILMVATAAVMSLGLLLIPYGFIVRPWLKRRVAS